MMRSACIPPRCKSINNLGATLDTWEDLVRQCAAGGGDLVLNTRQKAMALIQLVPEEIESVYETGTKYGTYEAKLEYARWRSTNAQNKNLGNAQTKKLAQVSSVEDDSPEARPPSSPETSDQSWIEYDHAGMICSCREDENGDVCYMSKGKAKGKGKRPVEHESMEQGAVEQWLGERWTRKGTCQRTR